MSNAIEILPEERIDNHIKKNLLKTEVRQHYPVTTVVKICFPEIDQLTHKMASMHLFQEHICYIFIFILIIQNTQGY